MLEVEAWKCSPLSFTTCNYCRVNLGGQKVIPWELMAGFRHGTEVLGCWLCFVSFIGTQVVTAVSVFWQKKNWLLLFSDKKIFRWKSGFAEINLTFNCALITFISQQRVKITWFLLLELVFSRTKKKREKLWEGWKRNTLMHIRISLVLA